MITSVPKIPGNWLVWEPVDSQIAQVDPEPPLLFKVQAAQSLESNVAKQLEELKFDVSRRSAKRRITALLFREFSRPPSVLFRQMLSSRNGCENLRASIETSLSFRSTGSYWPKQSNRCWT